MSYIKVVDGVVVQKQPNKQQGFLYTEESVVCGMLYDGRSFSVPEVIVDVENAARLKMQSELVSMTHTFPDGRVIQVREIDEPNFVRAYRLFALTGAPSIDWKMEDNIFYPTTESELREAQDSGILQGAAIWETYANVTT